MLEKNGRQLPPDLRAAHRHYIHRSRVNVELLKFEKCAPFESSDSSGTYYNADMVCRPFHCAIVRDKYHNADLVCRFHHRLEASKF